MFQKRWADWRKVLDPIVVKLADRAKSWIAEEDQRVREGV